MGIVIKQGIKSSIISYIGIAIGVFNILWLFPKFLDPEQIGLLRLLQDFPLLLALFVQLGTHSLIDKYFFHFENKEKKNNGFLFIIIFYPLIGFSFFTLLFFGLYEFWKSFYIDKSSLFLRYFHYIYPLTLIIMYTGIIEIYLRVNKIISYPNFLREVLIRFFTLIIVLLFVFRIFNLDNLILAYLISTIFILGLIIIYTKKRELLYFTKPPASFFNKKLALAMLTYVSFMVSGTIGTIMLQKIDNLMIASIAKNGLADVGVYSLAYFIGTVVEIPRKSITQITIPLLSKAVKDNDTHTINTLYKKNSLNQFIIGIILFICIWVNVDDLLSLIPNHEKYLAGKYVILFIGLAKLTDMATSINSEIIQLSHLYKFNLIAMLFLGIATVLLNLLLIPEYNIVGAAVAFGISIFLFNILKTYYIWIKMKIQPFSYHFIHLILIFGILLLLSFFQPGMKHSIVLALVFIAIKSLGIMVLYFIAIRYWKISDDLNLLIDKILVRISNKTGIALIKKL
jgi:O-antigen/teichoic acid export membrane protein